MLEIRIVIVFGGSEVELQLELTGKGNLWAAGNIVYFDFGGGYIHLPILSSMLVCCGFYWRHLMCQQIRST